GKGTPQAILAFRVGETSAKDIYNSNLKAQRNRRNKSSHYDYHSDPPSDTRTLLSSHHKVASPPALLPYTTEDPTQSHHQAANFKMSIPNRCRLTTQPSPPSPPLPPRRNDPRAPHIAKVTHLKIHPSHHDPDYKHYLSIPLLDRHISVEVNWAPDKSPITSSPPSSSDLAQTSSPAQASSTDNGQEQGLLQGGGEGIRFEVNWLYYVGNINEQTRYHSVKVSKGILKGGMANAVACASKPNIGLEINTAVGVDLGANTEKVCVRWCYMEPVPALAVHPSGAGGGGGGGGDGEERVKWERVGAWMYANCNKWECPTKREILEWRGCGTRGKIDHDVREFYEQLARGEMASENEGEEDEGSDENE
ncbi:hypothetical protein BJ875DRAFT_525323, partial [Amylocarpus encephaloides]